MLLPLLLMGGGLLKGAGSLASMLPLLLLFGGKKGGSKTLMLMLLMTGGLGALTGQQTASDSGGFFDIKRPDGSIDITKILLLTTMGIGGSALIGMMLFGPIGLLLMGKGMFGGKGGRRRRVRTVYRRYRSRRRR